MTANEMFKVGDRVNVDKQPDVPVVALRCAMCAAAAGIEVEKLSAVPTPETRVWVPAFLKRWIPRWEREKYISLEEAIEREPAFAALTMERNGRTEARRVCAGHGKELRTARIWTDRLFEVKQRQAAAAEKNATESFSSIASILAGKQAQSAAESQGEEPEDDGAGAQARAEQEDVQRKLAAAAAERTGEAADPKPKKGKGRKADAKDSTKGRSKSKLDAEIAEALDGSNEPFEN